MICYKTNRLKCAACIVNYALELLTNHLYVVLCGHWLAKMQVISYFFVVGKFCALSKSQLLLNNKFSFSLYVSRHKVYGSKKVDHVLSRFFFRILPYCFVCVLSKNRRKFCCFFCFAVFFLSFLENCLTITSQT